LDLIVREALHLMSMPGQQEQAVAGDRPRRRRLDAAARRETILDAAIPLFASAGYEQTRMSDVAERVGVTEPVIFQNFGTKAELFAAALERAADDAVSHLNAMAEEHANVHDWLGHLLSAEHLDRLHTEPMFGVFFAIAHRHQVEASIAGALHRCVTRVAEAVAGILRRGQTERSIRDDTSPDTLAWLVVSLIQARQFRRTHTAEPSPALEHDLVAAILDVVRSRLPRLE
jgi:AcrR family transcriptional regulator